MHLFTWLAHGPKGLMIMYHFILDSQPFYANGLELSTTMQWLTLLVGNAMTSLPLSYRIQSYEAFILENRKPFHVGLEWGDDY